MTPPQGSRGTPNHTKPGAFATDRRGATNARFSPNNGHPLWKGDRQSRRQQPDLPSMAGWRRPLAPPRPLPAHHGRGTTDSNVTPRPIAASIPARKQTPARWLMIPPAREAAAASDPPPVRSALSKGGSALGERGTKGWKPRPRLNEQINRRDATNGRCNADEVQGAMPPRITRPNTPPIHMHRGRQPRGDGASRLQRPLTHPPALATIVHVEMLPTLVSICANHTAAEMEGFRIIEGFRRLSKTRAMGSHIMSNTRIAP